MQFLQNALLALWSIDIVGVGFKKGVFDVKWFDNLKTMQKLLVCANIIGLFVAVVGFLGWNGLTLLHQEVGSIYENRMQPFGQLGEARRVVLSMRVDMHQAVLASTPASKQEALDKITRDGQGLNSILKAYTQSPGPTGKETESIRKAVAALNDYEIAVASFQGLVLRSNIEAVQALSGEVDQKSLALENALNELITLQKQEAALIDARGDADFIRTTRKIAGFSIFALLLAVGISIYAGRQISKPLKDASLIAGEIAGGNLNVHLPERFVGRKDEVGDLARSLKKMLEDLRGLVKEINQNSAQIAASSQQLSASSQDITANMEEVTAAIEEVSSGLESVSASSQQVSASSQEMTGSLNILAQESGVGTRVARKTETRVLNIKTVAEEALGVANSTLADVQQRLGRAIERAAVVNQISSLADVITGISSQTNLLALNAAIEAARAGEQGKGFAVVAEEVRRLAEESSQTVENIKQLTDEVQEAMDLLVEGAQDSLIFLSETVVQDYKTYIKTVERYAKDAVGFSEITSKNTGMSEQVLETVSQVSRAIEQVALTMGESSRSAQDIARGAESTSASLVEMAEASARLAENAETLNRLVERFRV